MQIWLRKATSSNGRVRQHSTDFGCWSNHLLAHGLRLFGEEVNQDMEIEGSDMPRRPQSSPEKIDPRLENLPGAKAECNAKVSDPSNRSLVLQEEEPGVNHEDSTCCNSEKLPVTDGGSNNLESAANKINSVAIMEKDNLDGICETQSRSLAQLIKGRDTAGKITSLPSMMVNASAISLSARTRETGGEKSEVVLDNGQELSTDMDLEDNEEQEEFRVVCSGARTRSLSPSSEYREGHKRPALICDFFAKGWCIKGSSCRFLHVKDDVKTFNQVLEVGSSAANLMKEDKGEGQIPLRQEESKRLHVYGDQNKFPLLERDKLSTVLSHNSTSKDDPMISSPFEDKGLETFERTRGSSPLVSRNLVPVCGFSGGSLTASSDYHGSKPSYVSNLDHPTSATSRYLQDSLLKASLTSGGMPPSHRVSAWTSSPFPSRSYLNSSSLGSQTLLNSNSDHLMLNSSSLLQSAAPFCYSQSENLPPFNDFDVSLRHLEHKAGNSSNDWEPSVPFRPSFFITRMSTTSPGSQYDPIRDSFDSPAGGEKNFKFSFSFSNQETSAFNAAHQRMNGDHLVDPESNASSYSRLKNSPTRHKVGDSASAKQNDDGSDHKKTNVQENNEMEVEQRTLGNTKKESKATRYFRAALVNYIKELLKPYWQEGQVSKDIHNLIVKKASEKVLSSFQPLQIPATVESTKQYLSSSRRKLAKLVEGYVAKHGKS